MGRGCRILLPALALGLIATIAPAGGKGARDPKEADAMAFTLTSPSFSAGSTIPSRHTCDDADASPALQWTEPPAGTRSLALIVDDPDAPVGTWVHWVLFDLPPTQRSLSEGIRPDRVLGDPKGSRQGTNDFRRIGWGGPCPPPGTPHRYVFKLYALDGPLGLEPGASKAEVERAMKGHVLGQAELIGKYARGR